MGSKSPRKRDIQDAEILDFISPAKLLRIGTHQASYGEQNGYQIELPPPYCQNDLDMQDDEAKLRPFEKICYGALCGAKAQIDPAQGRSIHSMPWSRYHTFHLVSRDKYYHLIPAQPCSKDSENLGMLDLVRTRQLHSLDIFSDISFIAVVETSKLTGCSTKSSNKKLVIDISVNIMGPGSISDEVGTVLADNSVYLQHPCFLQSGMRYMNPQFFYANGVISDLTHLIGPEKDPRFTRMAEELESVLGSLDGAICANDVMPTAEHAGLIESVKPLVSTPLKSHQEHGLRFIMQRENFSFCRMVMSDLRTLIGSRSSSSRASVGCLGGIVADVMGMGKTLLMLSALTCSMDAARSFEATENSRTKRLKATLIVVTSRQVLDVWISEIGKHFHLDAVKFARFHGDKRAKAIHQLVEYDIVLTTYRTLVSDWKTRRVLQEVEWFRVVLDEAHWIRNQASEQFKAAKALQAERRWCLTGTPIQNSLDDLQSLLRFLDWQPFSNKAFFEKQIVEPLRSENKDPFRNLKLLLQVICLRRSNVSLHLPSATTEIVSITRSDEEIAAYDRILADCQAAFEKIVSTKSDLKKYNVLFTTIMKLRRLCNHGTLQINRTDNVASTETWPMLEGRTVSADTDFTCEFCSGEDEDAAVFLNNLDICPECSRSLKSSKVPQPTGLVGGLSFTQSNSPMTPVAGSSGYLTPQSVSPRNLTPSLGHRKGSSSKLMTVVNNIQLSLIDTKHLVFTPWRATLDILANMLEYRDIPLVRIDGRVGFDDRQKILTRFREDPNLPVLLISIETGAVGLNLTAANRVHIVEPQWNPSVEEQAIARAVRMGQTRPVTIIKYITEGTVEQNILTLQKKKTRLAKFSLDGNTDADASGSLDDLKFVLDT